MGYLIMLFAAQSVSPESLPQPSVDSNEVSTIISVALGILGALALLMITVSGLRYITSGGNPEKTAKAKSGIVYSLVGLIVAISAEAILGYVTGQL